MLVKLVFIVLFNVKHVIPREAVLSGVSPSISTSKGASPSTRIHLCRRIESVIKESIILACAVPVELLRIYYIHATHLALPYLRSSLSPTLTIVLVVAHLRITPSH